MYAGRVTHCPMVSMRRRDRLDGRTDRQTDVIHQ